MNTVTTMQRRTAVAGRFYPADPVQLAQTVQAYLSGPIREPLLGVRALIVPHAGYPCSGVVAGAGYRMLRSLPPGARTIYLMGPAHWKAVHGIGLSSVASFVTPLGAIPIATERAAELMAFGKQFHFDDAAHAPEHCLEVQLPFLQTVMDEPRIVPMLLDDCAEPERVGGVLARQLEAHPEDLIIVSSDLSHYHTYDEAVAIDYAFLKAVATGDFDAANVGEACGLIPILALMNVAERLHWHPHLLAYANSGDTCGTRREVVGYGAVAYTACRG